jgi:iron complex outermembrane receptor protein
MRIGYKYQPSLSLFACIGFILYHANVSATEELPSLIVQDDGIEQTPSGDVIGYQALTADSSTKTRTALKEIPQSIQVITNNLMHDQQVQSVSEALLNVSGVVTNNPVVFPGFESTLVRGFAAEQLQDGSSLHYNTGNRESTINIERIEVLKGSNGVLYGGNSGTPVGGAINIISKTPQKDAMNTAGVTLGSNGLVKPSFDINQPVSNAVLFRVTGEYTKSNSEIDVLDQKSYNVNPSMKWLMSPTTSLLIQGRISRWNQQDYQGLPATGTVSGSYRLDRDMFVGNRSIPNSQSSLDSLTATLEHQLGGTWSFSSKVRMANSDFDEKVQLFAGNTPNSGSSTWNLYNTSLYQKQKDMSINAELKGKIGDKNINSDVIIGVERTSLDDEGYMGGMMNYMMGMADAQVNLLNPVFSTPYHDPSLASRWSGKVQNTTQGAYTQFQTNLYDRLHLVGGMKLASVEVKNSDNFGENYTTEKTKLLPRAGVVYDLNDMASVFASYSEGMRGVGWGAYTGTPRPVESTQKEAGVKVDINKQLTGSLAVFQIDRLNTAVPDPATGGFTQIPDGKEESKGTELDLLWQPTPKFSLLANYANTDAVYTKSAATTIPAGNSVAGVPEHSGRVWANYRFKEGKSNTFTIGGGVYAQSSTWLTGSNDVKVPSFHTFDLRLGYETKQYETALTVKNLTDEQYYERYNYFGGRVAPGLARTLLLSTSVKF